MYHIIINKIGIIACKNSGISCISSFLIFFSIFLILLHPALAEVGWICAESAGAGVNPVLNKYLLKDGKLINDQSDFARLTKMDLHSLDQEYKIIENNDIGLIAVFAESKNYPSTPTNLGGSSIYSDVILIEKLTGYFKHVSVTDKYGSSDEVKLGNCTKF